MIRVIPKDTDPSADRDTSLEIKDILCNQDTAKMRKGWMEDQGSDASLVRSTQPVDCSLISGGVGLGELEGTGICLVFFNCASLHIRFRRLCNAHGSIFIVVYDPLDA